MDSQKHAPKSDLDQADAATQPRGCLRRMLRWGEHVFAATCLLGVLVMFTPIPRLMFLNLDRQSPLEKADFIICLGGDPARVLEGVRLLQEGYAPKLILSNNGEGADKMMRLAIEWGASPDCVLVDHDSYRTVDHPGAVERNCGVRPEQDRCIIVTTVSHMARSEAVFEKAGYKKIIMREPRWEREFRVNKGWRNNVMITPQLLYEYTARLQYWMMGYT